MTAPNSKEWEAFENSMPVGDVTLMVTGKVETTNGRIIGVLTDREPQGFNPAILMLDLSLCEIAEDGTADVAFRPTKTYRKPVERGAIKTVQIMWAGRTVAEVPVKPIS